jgi:hypothetical protein
MVYILISSWNRMVAQQNKGIMSLQEVTAEIHDVHQLGLKVSGGWPPIGSRDQKDAGIMIDFMPVDQVRVWPEYKNISHAGIWVYAGWSSYMPE